MYYCAILAGIMTATGVPLWNLVEVFRDREPADYRLWWLLLGVPVCLCVMLVSLRIRNSLDKKD
jgi:hypothetical protein